MTIRSGGHSEALRPGRAVGEEVELTRRVGVGVDAEEAARLERERDELVGRVAALGSGVDLDGDVVRRARREDRLRIELARRPGPAPALDERRPVQWPSTFVRGFSIAPSIRLVIAAAGLRSRWTEATTTSSRSSNSGSWSRPRRRRM